MSHERSETKLLDVTTYSREEGRNLLKLELFEKKNIIWMVGGERSDVIRVKMET